MSKQHVQLYSTNSKYYSSALAFVAFSWSHQQAALSAKIVPISEIPVFPVSILEQVHYHTQSQNAHQVKSFWGR